MTTMINPQDGAADAALAAQLLRARWQERPAYFPPLALRTRPKLHARWLRVSGEVASVMHWSDLRGVRT